MNLSGKSKMPKFESTAGEKSRNAKLNEAAALDIKFSGDSVSDAMLKHQVSKQTVYDIRAGRRWKHLTQEGQS